MLIPYNPDLHGFPLYILATTIVGNNVVDNWQLITGNEVTEAEANAVPWLFAVDVPDEVIAKYK